MSNRDEAIRAANRLCNDDMMQECIRVMDGATSIAEQLADVFDDIALHSTSKDTTYDNAKDYGERMTALADELRRLGGEMESYDIPNMASDIDEPQ